MEPTNMTTDEVLKIHEDMCHLTQSIMKVKQADYTNGTDNPFRNSDTVVDAINAYLVLLKASVILEESKADNYGSQTE